MTDKMIEDVKRSRGRPRNLKNRTALLDAGKKLLLEKGLSVSVDAIVAKADVSKATFYNYFADKEAFIEAVLSTESDRTITDSQLLASSSKPLREALVEFGVRYLNFANEYQLIKWDRLIASASDIYP